MTINALSKILDEFKKKGKGRMPVEVDKSSLYDGGCFIICGLKSAEQECVYISDGDGGYKENKDGSESLRQCLVLKGGF